MRVAVKRVGKPLEIVDVTDKYRGDCAERLVGCDKTESVWLDSEYTLSLNVDEEGLIKELPINFLVELNSVYFPIQKMVGTVVFIRTKPISPCKELWDYEVTDLTDKDIRIIEEVILNEERQKDLNNRFKDYGKGRMICRKIL